MSLQDIQNMSESQFVDLFGAGETKPNPTSFSSFENNSDIFNSTTDTTTVVSTTDTTTTIPSTTDTTTEAPLEEVDLLDENGKPKEGDGGKSSGRPPKYDFTEMSGYFEDRIKKNLFVPLEVENEKGEIVPFVPKTPEEFDEFISFQVDNKIEGLKKNVDQVWYNEKTPAWKFVAQYAEKVMDPSQLIPVLQGVSNIQSISAVDENQPEGAEELVRYQLQIAKTPKAVIDAQIEGLKASNKLLDVAKELKPELVKAEQLRLKQIDDEETTKLNDYRNTVISIRDNAIKTIEAPFGSEKLKQEEKAAVYELIAVPNPETRGYAIFDVIDNLFEKGDFEKLRKVALLLTNEDAFNKYITSGALNKSAAALERKIRVAADKGNQSKDDNSNPPPTQRSQNNQYKSGTGRTLFSRG